MLTNRSARERFAAATRWRRVSVRSSVRVSVTSMRARVELRATPRSRASASAASRAGRRPRPARRGSSRRGRDRARPAAAAATGVASAAAAPRTDQGCGRLSATTKYLASGCDAGPSFQPSLDPSYLQRYGFRIVCEPCCRGFAPVHVLLLVAFLEVAINRVAVPMLRPGRRACRRSGTRCSITPGCSSSTSRARSPRSSSGRAASRRFAARRRSRRRRASRSSAAGVLAAIPLVVRRTRRAELPLELRVRASRSSLLVVSGFGAGRDLGAQIGLVACSRCHCCSTRAGVVGAKFLWPESTFDGPGVTSSRARRDGAGARRAGSPYVLRAAAVRARGDRPRPVDDRDGHRGARRGARADELPAGREGGRRSRSASSSTGAGRSEARALPARGRDARLDAGVVRVRVERGAAPDRHRPRVRRARRLWLPLAAPLPAAAARRRARSPRRRAACARRSSRHADSRTRRRRSRMRRGPRTSQRSRPGLKRTLTDVHRLTTRGDGGLASSVIIGEAGGMPVRTRIERIDGCVLALDVVIGREVDEVRGATLTLWAIPPRAPRRQPGRSAGDAAVSSPTMPRSTSASRSRGNARVFDDAVRRGAARPRGRDARRLGRVLGARGPALPRLSRARRAARSSAAAVGSRARPLGVGRAAGRVVELLVEIADRGVEPAPPVAPAQRTSRS